jgi:hypothetical protein
MRKAEEKERNTKVSEVAKRVERRKKSNGALDCPRIRGKQQRGEDKQRPLSKEKAAAIDVDKAKESAPESMCGYMERIASVYARV